MNTLPKSKFDILRRQLKYNVLFKVDKDTHRKASHFIKKANAERFEAKTVMVVDPEDYKMDARRVNAHVEKWEKTNDL